MKGKEKKSNIKLFIIGAIVFLIFIFPLYWMIVTAKSDRSHVVL